MPDTSGKPLRLRDFIRVGDLFFSVVGYRNHPHIRCFLRYAPGNGGRFREGKKFRKLGHDDAVKIGEKFFRKEEGIFRVPRDIVDEVFKPEERLGEVMDYEVRKVVSYFEDIPVTNMGVTGSRLIGLRGDESDVDFIIYGRDWFRGREKIKRGIQRGKISEPDDDTWEFIYRKRRPPINFDAFLVHERRKFHRAFIGSTYFDLLYVRGYDELDRNIPETVGRKMGRMRVAAEVKDDRNIFDYPAYYPVKHKEIKAVLSFTHTYAGQAFRGEIIEAFGQVEEIEGKLYLIVGTKRETEDEYVVSRTLLNKLGIQDPFS